MRVFLIGFMASGKSTYGKKLASKLDVSFIDLDEKIEDSRGASIRYLMVKYGEDEFRKIEREILKNTIEVNDHCIIATGGGTPCFEDNMELMNRSGKTIYIEVDTGVLVNRLIESKKDRPLIWGKTPDDLKAYASNLLNQRKKYYESADSKVSGKSLKMEDLIELMPDEMGVKS